jgi:hypothetical protein
MRFKPERRWRRSEFRVAPREAGKAPKINNGAELMFRVPGHGSVLARVLQPKLSNLLGKELNLRGVRAIGRDDLQRNLVPACCGEHGAERIGCFTL